MGVDSSSTEASNVELVNPIDQLDVEPETEATFVVETPVSLVVDLGTGVKPVSAVQKVRCASTRVDHAEAAQLGFRLVALDYCFQPSNNTE